MKQAYALGAASYKGKATFAAPPDQYTSIGQPYNAIQRGAGLQLGWLHANISGFQATIQAFAEPKSFSFLSDTVSKIWVISLRNKAELSISRLFQGN